VDTPTINVAGGPVTVTPLAVVATAAVDTPTITAASVVEPATVVTTTAVDTPTIAAAAVVTPDDVARAFAVPTPTILAGGAAVVTPDAVAATVAVDTPTITAAAVVTPDDVAVTTAVPTPTILIAATVVTPDEVAAVAAVPTPTITAAATVTPAKVVTSLAVPTPSITITVAPLTVAINIVRFYRVGSTDFVLVKAVTRGATVGYNRNESWAPVSAPFNDSGEASGSYYDLYDDIYHRQSINRDAMHYIAPVWQVNTTDSDADLMVKVNSALVGAGYDRGYGKPII
jgi:hypothetical protein